MWGRVTLALIGALALVMTTLALTKSIVVKVELPPGATSTPGWVMAAWFFVLGAAVIIVGVTAVRIAVSIVRRMARLVAR